MAILNFPPTAGEPIDGSFTYSSDGVTYSWDGYKWTADTGSGGGGDANHSDGPTPPTTGELADQWYNTDDGRLYTYTADSSGTLVWIDASPDSIAGGSGGSGDGTTVNYNGASAWGSFNGSTNEEYASYNIASFENIGNGLYAVTFAKPMANNTYAVTSGFNGWVNKNSRTTTGFNLETYTNNIAADLNPVDFAVHSSNAIAPQSGVGADAWGSLDGRSNISDNDRVNAGFNINDVRRSGAGSYIVTLITPMPTADYAVLVTSATATQNYRVLDKTTSTFKIIFKLSGTTNNQDAESFNVAVFASSTVTPTYTWTRDGTRLEPANAGDDVGSSGGLSNTDTSWRISGEGQIDSWGPAGYGLTIADTSSGSAQETIVLNRDGTATFTGTNANLEINNLQGLQVYRKSSTASDSALGIYSDVGGIGTPTARINADGAATFAGRIDGTTTAPGIDMFRLQKNGVTQARITSNGSIFALDTTLQPQTSERRLKENIVLLDASSAWETIKSTPYYTYNFIGDDAIRYGPMADEVPTEMVVQPMEENAAGVMVARSDDEGPIRTFDNGMLQARLYTALQTALTRIETLEETNASLEARLTALEGGNN